MVVDETMCTGDGFCSFCEMYFGFCEALAGTVHEIADAHWTKAEEVLYGLEDPSC